MRQVELTYGMAGFSQFMIPFDSLGIVFCLFGCLRFLPPYFNMLTIGEMRI